MNVNNIEGYAEMTLEQKVAALEAYEPDMTGFVKKSVYDKTASDLAKAKQTIKDHMTEDEAKATEAAEKHAALMEELETLKAEKVVSGYVASYLAMGYEEKLAKSTAEALAKGDMTTVFKNQKTHADAREKALRTELLKQTPPPAAGTGDAKLTKEDTRKMTLAELTEFAKEHPDIFKEFYGGN
jgi:hypothetical protein